MGFEVGINEKLDFTLRCSEEGTAEGIFRFDSKAEKNDDEKN